MLEPLYDPATFVRALAHLKRTGTPFQATMAGDGPLRREMEESSLRLGCADRISFVGLVDPERLRGLYREHEVYVSMSRTDSTSQSLLEAMAAGLYPVVSDIPGNTPWIGAPVAESGPLRERGMAVPTADAYALARALAGVRDDAGADARVAGATTLVRATASWGETVAETERRLEALAASGATDARRAPGSEGAAP
jgi:glycosyltransferase involved in cell wall biosynthesis